MNLTLNPHTQNRRNAAPRIVFEFIVCATRRLVLVCETNLAAVPEYRSFDQINFADVREIAGRSGEFASATGKVHRISHYGEEGLRERSGCRDGRIEGERIAGLRNPVMLDMEYQRISGAGLGRAQQSSTHGAPKISGRRSHSRILIDGTEVGHDRSAHENAVTVGGPWTWDRLWRG